MIQNLLSGLIGAVVGAVLTIIGTWYIQARMQTAASEKRILDEVRLDYAKKLLQYLSRVLSREAPESLKDKVAELKTEWAYLNRQLYLLNAPSRERDQFDDRMMMS